uniref:DegV family EDD domain-containing protein n=1 Tax=Thermorudis peleae TaxID=1382356 RepID=A0A831TI56_9BACT
MPRVAVVTDSTADLPIALCHRYGITVVPMSIEHDGQFLDDKPELALTIARSSTSERLRVYHPPPSRFVETYRQLGKAHEAIVSIHLSQRLSGTLHSALEASRAVSGQVAVRVLDSGSVSMGLGFVALRAAQAALAGASLGEVVASAQLAAESVSVFFLLGSTGPLRQRRRIGWAAGLLTDVLGIRPLLTMSEGVVVPVTRAWARPHGISQLYELATEFPRIERLAVIRSPELRETELDALLWSICPPTRRLETTFSAALMSWFGPEAVGMAIDASMGGSEEETDGDVDALATSLDRNRQHG